MDTLERMISWFMNSQISDGNAYYAYYSRKGRGPVYPEITSYAVNLACILYARTHDSKFLARAESCASYLINTYPDGALEGLDDGIRYVFDTGIFIASMFDLYEVTCNEKYLNAAKTSLNWMLSIWSQNKFAAADRLPNKSEWYHLPSVHLVKLAIPLLKASHYLKDTAYQEVALRLLDEFKQLQMENGAFRVNLDSKLIMTHPHCYAIEGYLYSYHMLGDPKLLEIAQKASEWLRDKQNSDGSWMRCYSLDSNNLTRIGEKSRTSDATAQATRIWKLLGVNEEEVGRAYRYLEKESRGGGLRLFRNPSLAGKLLSWNSSIYSWPSFFYIHSLMIPFGRIDRCKELF
jgi:hypothetical protein